LAVDGGVVSPSPPPGDLVSYPASQPALLSGIPRYSLDALIRSYTRVHDEEIHSFKLSVKAIVTFIRCKRKPMVKCYRIFTVVKMLNSRNIILKGHKKEH
jgi:hypothetical protein